MNIVGAVRILPLLCNWQEESLAVQPRCRVWKGCPMTGLMVDRRGGHGRVNQRAHRSGSTAETEAVPGDGEALAEAGIPWGGHGQGH